MKRTTKKLNSLFWFLLAILPIIMKIIAFSVIQFDGSDPASSYQYWSDWYDSYFNGMFDAGSAIYNYIIVPLFKSIKFSSEPNANLFLANDMAIFVAHFIGVYIMRFLTNVILFIPRYLTNLLERSDN